MTIVYIILWIIGLVAVPLTVAAIATWKHDPNDEFGMKGVFFAGITLILYLIVSAVWFFIS